MAVTHTIRSRTGGTHQAENYTPSKAIRAFCAECMGWEGGFRIEDGKKIKKTLKEEIEDCPSTLCPLYPFRGNSRIDVPLEISEERRDELRKMGQKLAEFRQA